MFLMFVWNLFTDTEVNNFFWKNVCSEESGSDHGYSVLELCQALVSQGVSFCFNSHHQQWFHLHLLPWHQGDHGKEGFRCCSRNHGRWTSSRLVTKDTNSKSVTLKLKKIPQVEDETKQSSADFPQALNWFSNQVNFQQRGGGRGHPDARGPLKKLAQK